jgi:DNA primase
VATLGTALTLEHTNVLSRYTKKIVLAYDADSAGMKAALRGAAMFIDAEFDVRIARLPKGDDPDSILRRGATPEFAAAITDALPIIDYRLSLLGDVHDVSTPAGRSALLNDAVRILAEIPSTLERERYIRSLAVGPNHPNWESGRMAEEDIRKEIDQLLRRKVVVRSARASDVPAGKPASGNTTLGQAEQSVLRALIHGSKHAAMLVEVVLPDDFGNDAGREAAAAVLDMIDKQGSVNIPELLEIVSSEAGTIITEVAMREDRTPLTEEWLSGCAASMKKAHLKRLRTHDILDPYIKHGVIEKGDRSMERLRTFLRESGKVSDDGAHEGMNYSDS